jgi:hypothetical protein
LKAARRLQSDPSIQTLDPYASREHTALAER